MPSPARSPARSVRVVGAVRRGLPALRRLPAKTERLIPVLLLEPVEQDEQDGAEG